MTAQNAVTITQALNHRLLDCRANCTKKDFFIILHQYLADVGSFDLDKLVMKATADSVHGNHLLYSLLRNTHIMKTLIMVLAAISLCGCSALNNIDNGHAVECTANFKLETFAVAGSYPVNINRVKRDRFGRLFLRPASGKYIQFIGGGFKPAEQFSDVVCKNGEVL